MITQTKKTIIALLTIAGFGGMSLGNVAFDPVPPSHGYLYTGNNTWGLEFVPIAPVTVTDLGIWDYNSDGLQFSHSIGIWRKSDLTLLVSGIVSTGTSEPLIDEFRYVDVVDTPLNIGEHYLLGAHYPLVPAGEIIHDPLVLVEQLQIDPAIMQVGPNVLYGWPGFAPTVDLAPGSDPDGPFFFGPNFHFIPAPGAFPLGSIGICIIGLLRRRRTLILSRRN